MNVMLNAKRLIHDVDLSVSFSLYANHHNQMELLRAFEIASPSLAMNHISPLILVCLNQTERLEWNKKSTEASRKDNTCLFHMDSEGLSEFFNHTVTSFINVRQTFRFDDAVLGRFVDVSHTRIDPLLLWRSLSKITSFVFVRCRNHLEETREILKSKKELMVDQCRLNLITVKRDGNSTIWITRKHCMRKRTKKCKIISIVLVLNSSVSNALVLLERYRDTFTDDIARPDDFELIDDLAQRVEWVHLFFPFFWNIEEIRNFDWCRVVLLYERIVDVVAIVEENYASKLDLPIVVMIRYHMAWASKSSVIDQGMVRGENILESQEKLDRGDVLFQNVQLLDQWITEPIQ